MYDQDNAFTRLRQAGYSVTEAHILTPRYEPKPRSHKEMLLENKAYLENSIKARERHGIDMTHARESLAKIIKELDSIE